MQSSCLPMVKYYKPRRFPKPSMKIPSSRAHRYLSPEDARYLLKGKVLVEEKMDGKAVSFEADSTYIIFAEDLCRKHSIFYRIPARYAIFDIFDCKRRLFVFSEEKAELSKDIMRGKLRLAGASPVDFFPVPVVALGRFTWPELIVMAETISVYAIDPKTRKNTHMEGIVIKQDRDLFPEEQLRGKIIRPEFDSGIKVNYLDLPEVQNIIDPHVNITIRYSPASLRSPAGSSGF